VLKCGCDGGTVCRQVRGTLLLVCEVCDVAALVAEPGSVWPMELLLRAMHATREDVRAHVPLQMQHWRIDGVHVSSTADPAWFVSVRRERELEIGVALVFEDWSPHPDPKLSVRWLSEKTGVSRLGGNVARVRIGTSRVTGTVRGLRIGVEGARTWRPTGRELDGEVAVGDRVWITNGGLPRPGEEPARFAERELAEVVAANRARSQVFGGLVIVVAADVG